MIDYGGYVFYTVREPQSGVYNVAKFSSDYGPPLETYQLRTRGSGLSCSCPAGKFRTCKHQKIVDRWRKIEDKEAGYFFDEKTDQFVKLWW